MADPHELVARPIGWVRSGPSGKFSLPSQPALGSEEVNHIELAGDDRLELALSDLQGFDWIWLIWWFHLNTAWRPRVLPPRGAAVRRGLFSTRSPHRPNPIGLTSCQLLGIEGRVLTVGPLDLLEGTPILDIKPYLAYTDSHPEASEGWVGEVEQWSASPPAFHVKFSSLASDQAEWISAKSPDLLEPAYALLARDPSPHRTRRIIRFGDGFRLASGPWRLYYRLDGDRVLVDRIGVGITLESLQSANPAPSDRDLLMRFLEEFA